MYRITFIREKVDLQVPAGMTVLEQREKRDLCRMLPAEDRGSAENAKLK